MRIVLVLAALISSIALLWMAYGYWEHIQIERAKYYHPPLHLSR